MAEIDFTITAKAEPIGPGHVQPGETGTVGVIDCRVRHAAGSESTLCGRWSRASLWAVRPGTNRAALPLCKRCSTKTKEESEMSTAKPTEIKVGQWIFRWSGGRIADISHVSRPAQALDVVQVGEYDIHTGMSKATMETFQATAHEWVEAYGEDFTRNVLPYRDPRS